MSGVCVSKLMCEWSVLCARVPSCARVRLHAPEYVFIKTQISPATRTPLPHSLSPSLPWSCTAVPPWQLPRPCSPPPPLAGAHHRRWPGHEHEHEHETGEPFNNNQERRRRAENPTTPANAQPDLYTVHSSQNRSVLTWSEPAPLFVLL